MLLDQEIDRNLDEIDLSDSESEINEVELMRQKLANKGSLNKEVGDILTEAGVEPSPQSNKIKNACDWLLNRNKSLTKQYVECIKNDLALEDELNKAKPSNLDDYADTSLEQPSYMDPED